MPRGGGLVEGASSRCGWLPPISALTSSRRFTLLNDFSACAIASGEIPQCAARAAAPVAFSTLYEPANGNSKLPQHFPSRNTPQLVRADSYFTSTARQFAFSLNP